MSYMDELREAINVLQHIAKNNGDGDGLYGEDGIHVGELAENLGATISQWVMDYGTPIQIERIAEGTSAKAAPQTRRIINVWVELDGSKSNPSPKPSDTSPPSPPNEEKPSR